MFVYCGNNPVMRIDPSGKAYEYDDLDDDFDFLDDPNKFGGGFANSGQGNGNTASLGINGGHYSGYQGTTSYNSNSSSVTNYGKGIIQNSNTVLPKNGTTVDSSTGLNMAIDYLGTGYISKTPDRYVSADGYRQIRISDADILGMHAGGPHINFDLIKPTYKTVHGFIY